jgi:hypothetical protein
MPAMVLLILSDRGYVRYQYCKSMVYEMFVVWNYLRTNIAVRWCLYWRGQLS